MLVSRLLRSLLRFFTMGIAPDEGGGAAAPEPAPAPAAETPAPAPAPAAETPAPAPAPAADNKPVDVSAGLNDLLDKFTEGTTPAPTPAPTAAPVASAPAKPTDKPADQIDLTPPEGMNERSTQRWMQLTERAKMVPDLERRATEATTSLDAVRKMVSDSGLDANEFSDMLGLARLVKSSSPQEAQQALQRLDGLRAEIAGRLGVEVPGIDPLAAHPDLKADVESMALTKERALEIARLRGKGQQADQLTQGQREADQFKRTVNDAAVSMERTLKTREGQPGHQEKLNYIATVFKDPARLQRFVTTYKPEQWEGALLDIYDTYIPPAPAPAPALSGPQPLRQTNTRPGAAVPNGPVTTDSALASAFASVGL